MIFECKSDEMTEGVRYINWTQPNIRFWQYFGTYVFGYVPICGLYVWPFSNGREGNSLSPTVDKEIVYPF